MDDKRKKVYWSTSSKQHDNRVIQLTGNHHICKPSNLQALKPFYCPRHLFFSIQVHYISMSDINHAFFCALFEFVFNTFPLGKNIFITIIYLLWFKFSFGACRVRIPSKNGINLTNTKLDSQVRSPRSRRACSNYMHTSVNNSNATVQNF